MIITPAHLYLKHSPLKPRRKRERNATVSKLQEELSPSRSGNRLSDTTMTTAATTCPRLIVMHICVSLAATTLMKSCPTRTMINVSWLRILIYVRFPSILQPLPQRSQEGNHNEGGTPGPHRPTPVPVTVVRTTDLAGIGLTHGK